MGSSLDWGREVFTMDDKLSRAVKSSFVRLNEKGLIYRSSRLVNWSCQLKTAIADIEVDYEDIPGFHKMAVPGHSGVYEFGVLVNFAYKVKDSDEEIVVATTRIETMLGDVAVAVNSKDARYAHLVGKQLVHPFVESRSVKVIVDDVLVDMAFGTGAVKITPAHDPNDYECGKRHQLEEVNIFTDDGRINEKGGMFAGQMRFDCRNSILGELEKRGLLRGKQANPMRLGFCQRSKDVIEPLIRPQWWINCQTIGQRMIDAVREGELTILPREQVGTWNRWLEGLKDWCVSRQLWWGHRIPAYQVCLDGAWLDTSASASWVIAEDEAAALAQARARHPGREVAIRQDEDVLDTWYSSGLFPFSVFGWPEDNPDLRAFFPNALLETGHDIIFFWVARMVMMSLWLTDRLPFKTVFLHSIVCDEDGRKMSKSLGNVINPLEIIDGATLSLLVDKIENSVLPKAEKTRSI
jgi:valyl-tRNA synthetase